MSTLQKIQSAVHHLRDTYISKAKSRRFFTGITQLSLCEFSSLNGAGRSLGLNRFTGENRIRRLVSDASLSNQVQSLLIKEVLVSKSGYWYCSLDHSQFGPFCIAVLAVSMRKGRAIPVWCQVNVSEAGLIKPLLVALEGLLCFLDEMAPHLQLVLVMDRWFASDNLFKLFEKHKVYFIARTKSDKQIQLPWDPSWVKTPILEVSHKELPITYRTHRLRLVRSEFKSGMKDPEPWFLLTNLPEEITRRQVLNRYAERFEIEEVFKDIKWLQRLEWQRIKKPEVIRCLLLFVFLGWWLLWRYVTPVIREQTPQTNLHTKKRLSWFRSAWEFLHRLLTSPLLPVVCLQGGGKK